MEISIEQVSKSYQDADQRLVVLDNVTAKFASCEHIAIMGCSGVGKSTLLHLLGGLDSPTSGSVRIGLQDLAELDADGRSDFRAKSIGFIFQFHHLLPDFSALENVAMPLYIQGLPEAEAEEQAQKLLERTGLGSRLKHRPGELSGGEQQRVAVARALVNRPTVVLADEPTGSLDQKTGLVVQELLREICRELKATLIVVTHSVELARSFDRVLEMESGGKLKNFN